MPSVHRARLAATAREGWTLGRLALPAMLAAGLVLRFWGIGSDGIWLDEGFALRVARMDLLSIPEFLARSDTHPPLHYALLHVWIRIFGESEAALRSMSAVATILLVPVLYGIGRRLGGRGVGLTAALFASLSPLYVRYGQEARMYGLLALLAGVSFLLLLELLERRTGVRIALYVLVTALMLYTHVYALFVVLAEAIYVLLLVRADGAAGRARRLELRSWALIVGAPLVLWSPWMVALARQTQEEVDGSGANLAWLAEPTATSLAETFGVYAGSRAGLVVLAALAIGLAAVLARAGGGLVALARDRRLAGPWLLLLVPIAVPFAVSWAALPIYQPKYTIPAGAGFVLLLAIATQRLPGARLRALAVVAVAATLLAGSVWHLVAFETDPWPDVVAEIEVGARSGDAVVFDRADTQDLMFDYYSDRDDLVKVSGEGPLPALGRRVWVVLFLSEESEAIRRELARRGYARRLDLRYDGRFGDIELLRFDRA